MIRPALVEVAGRRLDSVSFWFFSCPRPASVRFRRVTKWRARRAATVCTASRWGSAAPARTKAATTASIGKSPTPSPRRPAIRQITKHQRSIRSSTVFKLEHQKNTLAFAALFLFRPFSWNNLHWKWRKYFCIDLLELHGSINKKTSFRWTTEKLV